VNKKKQKNFFLRFVDAGAPRPTPDGPKWIKVFLLLFFQKKKTLPLLSLDPRSVLKIRSCIPPPDPVEAPTEMRRRTLLKAAPLLALPAIARGADARTLRVIPEADLAILDPVWTTATVTRDHAFMVFDTLYGFDADYNVQPQMVEGHTIEDNKIWTLKLRPGLTFHNNEPVRARDALASIRRWAARDSFGQTLLASTDALEAPDDRTIVFRLKKPFPVARALTNSALIMPESLASTDASKQISEMIGSGPFRFLPGERVAGAKVAYAKFDGYVPRPGTPSFTAGPKIAYVERVEWTVIPDQSTAAAAMLRGEMDWWGAPPDYLDTLRKARNIRLERIDSLGGIRILRFNHLHPPFDNPAIRRAILPIIQQSDYLTAVAGDDRTLWRDGVGVFAPGTPMANDAGIEILMGKRDPARAKRELAAAGYNGEKIVFMNPADQAEVSSNTLVAADALQKIGLNIDMQTMDWGTLMQRRAKMDPPQQGGWNLVCTGLTGSGCMDPSGHIALRGNGLKAWAGWPTMPKIEALRDAWFDTPDLAAQQAICVDIQKQFWQDVPYIPLGQRFGPYAFNTRVSDVRRGFPQFYGLKLSS
jgi:peptide/nickel transport system substrate-binding protein